MTYTGSRTVVLDTNLFRPVSCFEQIIKHATVMLESTPVLSFLLLRDHGSACCNHSTILMWPQIRANGSILTGSSTFRFWLCCHFQCSTQLAGTLLSSMWLVSISCRLIARSCHYSTVFACNETRMWPVWQRFCMTAAVPVPLAIVVLARRQTCRWSHVVTIKIMSVSYSNCIHGCVSRLIVWREAISETFCCVLIV